MPMFDKPVVYLDIETSGSNPYRSRIIEVAAIRVEDGQVVEDYHSLVNPGTSLPFWITKLTGLTDNDLVQAPYFEDIAYQLNSILDGATFIAHNVRFDYSYVKRQLEGCGYKYNPDLLCTVRLSRALYPEHKGHSLEKIIGRHAIPVKARHRAYDDAMAIKHFTELAYREHGHERFSAAIARQLKTKTLPPNLDEKYIEGLNNKPGVYVFENENGQAVYVGKSINLRKRVLSHFTQDTKLNKEMKISQKTHKLRVIETDSELEALLLESKMVKELLPVHNIELRRVKSHYALVKSVDDKGYINLSVESKDIAQNTDLNRIYGVYTSKAKAKAALEDKRKTYDLCSKLLGLEKTRQACFQYQLGKCKGACVGREAADVHNARLEIALERSKLESWPYSTPVVIQSGTKRQLVIDKWMVIGHINLVEEGEPDFRPVQRSFEVDTYRILRSYIEKHANSLNLMPIKLDQLSAA